MQSNEHEIIICAACVATDGSIIRGHRHHNCFQTMLDCYKLPDRERPSNETCGFITSQNRYVFRDEAYRIQIAAGIESVAPGGYRGEELFSEDLY